MVVYEPSESGEIEIEIIANGVFTKEDFLAAVLAKCPNGIDYDSMTSEGYPYRGWSNPPQRDRFMSFRIDGPDRPYDSEDRKINIYYQWPYYNIDCPNPPDTVGCIAFRTISGSEYFDELPDEACNEALDKLPPLPSVCPKPPCPFTIT